MNVDYKKLFLEKEKQISTKQNLAIKKIQSGIQNDSSLVIETSDIKDSIASRAKSVQKVSTPTESKSVQPEVSTVARMPNSLFSLNASPKNVAPFQTFATSEQPIYGSFVKNGDVYSHTFSNIRLEIPSHATFDKQISLAIQDKVLKISCDKDVSFTSEIVNNHQCISANIDESHKLSFNSYKSGFDLNIEQLKKAQKYKYVFTIKSADLQLFDDKNKIIVESKNNDSYVYLKSLEPTIILADGTISKNVTVKTEYIDQETRTFSIEVNDVFINSQDANIPFTVKLSFDENRERIVNISGTTYYNDSGDSCDDGRLFYWGAKDKLLFEPYLEFSVVEFIEQLSKIGMKDFEARLEFYYKASNCNDSSLFKGLGKYNYTTSLVNDNEIHKISFDVKNLIKSKIDSYLKGDFPDKERIDLVYLGEPSNEIYKTYTKNNYNSSGQFTGSQVVTEKVEEAITNFVLVYSSLSEEYAPKLCVSLSEFGDKDKYVEVEEISLNNNLGKFGIDITNGKARYTLPICEMKSNQLDKNISLILKANTFNSESNNNISDTFQLNIPSLQIDNKLQKGKTNLIPQITFRDESMAKTDFKLQFSYLNDKNEKCIIEENKVEFVNYKLVTNISGKLYDVDYEYVTDGSELIYMPPSKLSGIKYGSYCKSTNYTPTVTFNNLKRKFDSIYQFPSSIELIESVSPSMKTNVNFYREKVKTITAYKVISPKDITFIDKLYSQYKVELASNETSKELITRTKTFYLLASDSGNKGLYFLRDKSTEHNTYENTPQYVDLNNSTIEEIEMPSQQVFYDPYCETEICVDEKYLNLVNNIKNLKMNLTQLEDQGKQILYSLGTLKNGLDDSYKGSINQRNKILELDDSSIDKDYEIGASCDLTSAKLQLSNQEKMLKSQLESINKQIISTGKTLTTLERERENLLDSLKQQICHCIVNKEGKIYGFTYTGQLCAIVDKYENQIVFNYSDNVLQSIVTDSQICDFTYESGKLMSIKTPEGFIYRLSYEDNIISKISRNSNSRTENIKLNYDNNSNLVEIRTNFESLVTTYENNLVKEIKHYSLISNINNEKYNFIKENNILLEDFVFTYETCLTNVEEKVNYINKKVSYDYKGNIFCVETLCGNSKTVMSKAFNVNNLVTHELEFDNSSNCIVKSINIENGQYEKYNHVYDLSQFSAQELEILQKREFCAIAFKLSSSMIQASTFFNISMKIKIINEDSRVEREFYSNYFEIRNGLVLVPFSLIGLKNVSHIEFEVDFGDNLVTFANSQNLIMLTVNGTYCDYYLNDNVKLIANESEFSELIDYDFNKVTKMMTYTQKGIIDEKNYRYNQDGNCIYFSSNNTIEESEYDEKGNLVHRKTILRQDPSICEDSYYSYDEKGNLIEDKNKDESHLFENVHEGRVISIYNKSEGIVSKSNFSYLDDYLVKISDNNNKLVYNYDGQGRITSVDLNQLTNYISFEYGDYQTKTIPLYEAEVVCRSEIKHLSNGYSEEHLYDVNNNLIYKKNENFISAYKYDESNHLVSTSITDCKTNKVTIINNSYDIVNNLSTKNVVSDGAELYSAKLIRDDFDNVIGNEISVNGKLFTKENMLLAENKEMIDNLSLSYGENEMVNIQFKYDPLDRIEGQIVKFGEHSLCTFADFVDQVSEKSNMIGNYQVHLDKNCLLTEKTEYDSKQNIVKIANDNGINAYHYDSLNRLTREDNARLNKTFIYSYDRNGNILSKTISKLTDSNLLSDVVSIKYTYDVTNRDRLTSFNGENIEYDNFGNPIIYRNQSVKYNNDGKIKSIANINFDYDFSGFRKTKTVGSETINYIYIGGKLLKETSTKNQIDYIYANNVLTGFVHNGNKYLYVKDSRSTIVGIIDVNLGKQVCEYIYDAWGNCQVFDTVNNKESTDINFIGNINPIRFRNYYFDYETGLYYLKERFYDPQTGRFLTPDKLSNINKKTVCCLNLYVYCANNPVKYSDESGQFFFLAGLIFAGIGALVGFASSVISQGIEYGWDNISWGQVFWDTFLGGVSGLVSTFSLGTIGGFFLSAAFSAIQYCYEQSFHGKNIDFTDLFLSATFSGLLGVAGTKLKLGRIGDKMADFLDNKINKFINLFDKKFAYSFFEDSLNLINGELISIIDSLFSPTSINIFSRKQTKSV